MKPSNGLQNSEVYEAPLVFIGIFYAFLLAWVGVSVYLLGVKTMKSGWALTQLLMVAFVIAYTWYFSLGISYQIKLEAEGNVQLKSFRRELKLHASDIDMLEGPRFGIPIGFIRFRLAREKAYLFCVVSNKSLKRILLGICKANPDIKVKDLSLYPY